MQVRDYISCRGQKAIVASGMKMISYLVYPGSAKKHVREILVHHLMDNVRLMDVTACMGVAVAPLGSESSLH
jgi:hypothetical protein